MSRLSAEAALSGQPLPHPPQPQPQMILVRDPAPFHAAPITAQLPPVSQPVPPAQRRIPKTVIRRACGSRKTPAVVTASEKAEASVASSKGEQKVGDTSVAAKRAEPEVILVEGEKEKEKVEERVEEREKERVEKKAEEEKERVEEEDRSLPQTVEKFL